MLTFCFDFASLRQGRWKENWGFPSDIFKQGRNTAQISQAPSEQNWMRRQKVFRWWKYLLWIFRKLSSVDTCKEAQFFKSALPTNPRSFPPSVPIPLL